MGTCSESTFSLFSLFSEGAHHLFLKLHDNHFSKLWAYGKHFHQVHDIFELGRSLFEMFFYCHGNYAIWTIDVIPLLTNSSEDVVILLRRCCAPWQKYQKWKVVIPARSQRKMRWNASSKAVLRIWHACLVLQLVATMQSTAGRLWPAMPLAEDCWRRS